MDISLYYQEKGSGTPLILLHGNGENGDYFIHQIQYFSRFYRVLAVDTRGHGRSPRGTAPFTIAQFAEDLNALMEKLHIDKAILLGFSDGANTALRFTLKYPYKVIALILNGGNLNPAGVKRTTQFPIELGYKIAGLFAAKSQKAKQHAELLNLMVNEPHITPEELFLLSVPTLVIAGTRDMIKESHTKEITRNIPHATLQILPGNHFLANKKPETFNRTVDAFLCEQALR